jgi:RNA polymerase sigma factor (sigma-70 family)
MSGQRRRSDAELLAAASRDPEAFGELYDRYAGPAFGWARRAGLREADALDLVAELFAKAWVSRRRFRPPGDGSAAGWLYGIARNLVAAQRRRGRIDQAARRRLGMPLAVESVDDTVVERVDAAATRRRLDVAMDDLPATQRAALEMRVVGELAYPELAARLDCTETTARKRVSLGLRFLRNRLAVTPQRGGRDD